MFIARHTKSTFNCAEWRRYCVDKKGTNWKMRKRTESETVSLNGLSFFGHYTFKANDNYNQIKSTTYCCLINVQREDELSNEKMVHAGPWMVIKDRWKTFYINQSKNKRDRVVFSHSITDTFGRPALHMALASALTLFDLPLPFIQTQTQSQFYVLLDD